MTRFHIPPELGNHLHTIAQREGRDVAEVTADVLIHGLEMYEKCAALRNVHANATSFGELITGTLATAFLGKFEAGRPAPVEEPDMGKVVPMRRRRAK